MVKILQAYNFAKQHTYSLNGDILSASLIDSSRIAVSSAEQFIEIYDIGGKQRRNELNGIDLNAITTASEYAAAEAAAAAAAAQAAADERLPTKYTLATVGEVVHLIYCEAGKYLLTLEKETLSSPVQTGTTGMSCTSSSSTSTICPEEDTKMFVRIYANFWKFPEAKLIDLPITIRIASMTTPKAPLVESIDVIELPLRSPPDLIQCCQTSGNIIVSSKERIYLYEYTQCIHETTQPRFSYIDFLPFKFFVNLNFLPLRLCLAENVIAAMNNRYCVAFKVVDVVGSSAAGGAHCSPMDNDYGGGGGGGRGDGGGLDDVADVDVDEAISSTESSLMSKVSGGPSSHNSFETDSLETTSSGRPLGVAGFPGRTPIDFNVARIVNSACGREFEVDLKSQWELGDAISVGGGMAPTLIGSSGVGGGCGGDTQEIIIMPARANDIKIKLVNEAKAMNLQRVSSHGNMAYVYNEDTSVQYDVRKLLQICMKSSEPNGRIVDILRCMDLKAIYQRNPNEEGLEDSEYDMGNQQVPGAVTTTKHANRRTLKSGHHQSCVGYALLVASSVDGYLYQFCAQGKWYSENEKPIAVYSFTAPVLRVHINDYVIYAITTESVETHTSRIGHKLYHNRFEYPTLGGLFPEESSPDVNSAIAVIGLCAFMHVQYVCVNHNNLVLITNSALANNNNEASKRRSGGAPAGSAGGRNIAARILAEAKVKNLLRSSSNNAAQPPLLNEWTLYNLDLPPVEHVIEDLEAIAESYRAASSSNFYDLMEEAHVMLRLSLSLHCEQLTEEREQQLRSKFVENCRKLADFSIRSRKKEVYLQATGFYKMCNLQLTDIYSNYINCYVQPACVEQQQLPFGNCSDSPLTDETQLVGLIYTVKMFLLGLGTDRLLAAFLNQLVKPFFTPDRVIEQGYPQVPLSLEFLNMFIKYSPSDIPQIMLNSPVVADAISGELVNYLKYLDKLNPDENLLLAVTACRMSNYLLAQEVVARLSRRELTVALMKHKNVLFDDGTVLFQRRGSHHHDTLKFRNGSSGPGAQLHKSAASQIMRRQQKRKPSFGQVHSASPLLAPTHTGHGVISFSDFTETILLAAENADLIEAISDVFIHALCIEHSITLEIILQLFLNYIASHIGHKGYQTSQKVFVNILQVYYYDYFDVNPMQNPHDIPTHTPPYMEGVDEYDETSSKAPSLNSERDNESIANSLPESNSGASSSIDDRSYSHPINRNRIVYDQLHDPSSHYKRNIIHSPIQLDTNEQQTPTQGNSDAETNLKGLKILFRMYMGRLKALSDLITDLQSADIEQQPVNEDFVSLRMECIKFMIRHLQELRAQQQQQQLQQNTLLRHSAYTQYYYAKAASSSVAQPPGAAEERKIIYVPFIPDYKLSGEEFERHMKSYLRPIPCLLDRPQYLNRLPPFRRDDFSYPNRDEGECEVHFMGWHNELLTLTLKIQSLLASTKIDREIIEEFIAFIQKTPDLIGIDSFLVIVLPKHLAINYMLNFCPEYMWQYGKSNGFTPKHWESLLKKILSKQNLVPNWKAHITEILNNLVAELSFEELLQCFPSEAIKNHKTEAFLKEFSDNRINYVNDKLTFEDKAQQNTLDNETMLARDHLPMDNIDENNVFELTLRKAVSKQRSIALRSMIESTGTQLFDATSNPMYNL
ncbi:uncharacterized protein LOC118739392 [Rhagoletis pomonella]|uniref:uncharacterized protein LOC118739392 n=1 Tax=Rhagoletis pomonella TaxID=28610 RepID=UPI001781243E|nr:uncharacterized protein LOC118739392 [Rhagoletis pomonella]XP_036326571.1 uncharacterized protein LOC118739392 [Rhagoletis pomonella]